MPPKFESTVSQTYPLKDFRHDVFGPTGQDYDLARSVAFSDKMGFTAVKHTSKLFAGDGSYEGSDAASIDFMDEVYYPEIEALVKEVTGCSKVFISNSSLRGPHKARDIKLGAGREFSRDTAEFVDIAKPMHKADAGPCIRQPHCDSTPLGARRAARFWREDFIEATREAGIHEAEDRICEAVGLKAEDKESDDVIEAKYNDGQSLGPRYANYSIWRPLKKVTRDPLAFAPTWQFTENEGKGHDVYPWPYQNRNMGSRGDWLRELEMLRVKQERAEALGKAKQAASLDEYFKDPAAFSVGQLEDGKATWYFLDSLDVDEVLFVKLFDSAGLGGGASGVVPAPLHGSPDLGEAAPGDARESIEVRLMCVW